MAKGAGTRHRVRRILSALGVACKEKREIDIHASESVGASCQVSKQSYIESLEGTE